MDNDAPMSLAEMKASLVQATEARDRSIEFIGILCRAIRKSEESQPLILHSCSVQAEELPAELLGKAPKFIN